jgi:uncharacterized protein (TIGR02265 family)
VSVRIPWDSVLLGAVDPEERFARFPPGFTLKGMFFSRLVEIGGRHAATVQGKLVAPPRLGRYVPFADYPQVDYSRLAHAVATGMFPRLPVREAMRQLARLDYATFADSTVGRVSLALVSGAESALSAFPTAFSAVLRGGTLTVKKLGPGKFDVVLTDFYGWVDCYMLGTLEGVVDHFGRQFEAELDLHSPISATYHLTLV